MSLAQNIDNGFYLKYFHCQLEWCRVLVVYIVLRFMKNKNYIEILNHILISNVE